MPEPTLTEMALALQARDRQFQQRLTTAMRLMQTDPAAALAEFQWAEGEHPLLDAQRVEFEKAMESFRQQAGMALTPQDAAVHANMSAMAHNNWLQILCGKAQALVVLNRLGEARTAVDLASASVGPQTSPEARGMLLQIRASILAASAAGL